MSCVSTQHLICLQVWLLTAAIIMITLQQMRVNTRQLSPAIVHFERDEFRFSRFLSEMRTHQPAISNLNNRNRSMKGNIQQFSLSNRGFKVAVMSFPSSTERQKKAHGTQTQK